METSRQNTHNKIKSCKQSDKSVKYNEIKY